MKQKPKYRLNIGMLDAFDYYLHYGEEELAFNTPDLLAYLNFGKEFRTPKELNFEILADEFKNKVFSGNYLSEPAVCDAALLMPGMGSDNVNYSTFFEESEIFGTIDFLGFGTGVIFEATGYYQLNQFFSSNNNWFLKAMQDKAVDQIQHIILIPGNGTDKPDSITVENFHIHNYDFSTLEEKVRGLVRFIDDHEELITNKNIFASGHSRFRKDSSADSKGVPNS